MNEGPENDLLSKFELETLFLKFPQSYFCLSERGVCLELKLILLPPQRLTNVSVSKYI